MHYNVKRAFDRWYAGVRAAGEFKLAYLGAYDMNGTIDVPHVGFDIVAGPGVDVVLVPGMVPLEHSGAYDAVASISSFQFYPHPQEYLGEARDLLAPRGWLFLTMCGWHCRGRHGTSSPTYDDSIRMSPRALRQAAERAGLSVMQVDEVDEHEHHDMVLTARKP